MPTLYEQVGGAPAIDRLIEEFYARIQADPVLQPFFAGIAMDRLKHMQKEFFAAALDGPITASEIDIARAHAGRGIQTRHFNIYVQHLLQTLQEHGFDADAQMEVIRRISTYVDQVTDQVGTAGD
ncbi:MAG: group I truncated hemoglobin [Planctomycetaceae bacterium]